MKDLQENNIPAEHQNEDCYFPDLNKGIRVLFVGNSITKHAPKPEVGWNNDCGMEASTIENDYVHILKKRIREIHPDASFAILQVADFERQFESFDIENNYRAAIDFDADIITMLFGANVPKEYRTSTDDPVRFGDRYRELRKALDKSGNAKVAHMEGFYMLSKIDGEREEAAKEFGDTYIKMGETRTKEEARGHFNHPNDLGMKEIADKFWNTIKEWM